MAKQPFKQAVREHLDAQSLSPSRLERLRELTREEPQPKVHGPSRPGAGRRFGVARSLAAVLVLAALTALGSQIWLNQSLADRIAAEVARNHLKLKPADIESANLTEIGDFLAHLDFNLVQSKQLDTSVWQLQGARYCEILGATAAQLRVLHRGDSAASLHTVYQAPYRLGWFSALPVLEQGEPPLEVSNSGLRIRIWLEQDVLFAMTAPR